MTGPGVSCTEDDLSMNSKCYKKFYNSSALTWFSASNDCLSRGGSLAVFTDIGRPSVNSELTRWLSTDRRYWIGLIRSWWYTIRDGKVELLCSFVYLFFFVLFRIMYFRTFVCTFDSILSGPRVLLALISNK